MPIFVRRDALITSTIAIDSVARRRIFLLIVIIVLATPLIGRVNAAADELQTYSFQLKNRPAAQIIPALQSMTSKSTTFVADGLQLLMRGDAESIEQVKSLLPGLDRLARMLSITVEHLDQTIVTRRGTQRIGDDEIDSNVQEPLRKPSKIDQTQHDAQSRSRQTIQVQEGEEGILSATQRTTTSRAQIDQHGLALGAQFDETGAGFSVVAYLRDDHHALVSLRSQRRSQPSLQNNVTDDAQIATHVTVPLNRWVTLALVNAPPDAEPNTIVRQTQRDPQYYRGIRIRVSEIKP